MRHDSKRVKHIASLIREGLANKSWRSAVAVESGLETYGNAVADPLIARIAELEMENAHYKGLLFSTGKAIKES